MVSHILSAFTSGRIIFGVTLLYIFLSGILFTLKMENQLMELVQHIQEVLPERGPMFLILTVIYLFIVLCIVIYRNTIHIKDYTFNEKTGLYLSKKDDHLVCTSCLLEKRRHSPVKHATHYYECQISECGKKYINPENPPQKKQRQGVSKRSSWTHNY